jgi:hypothetical protein
MDEIEKRAQQAVNDAYRMHRAKGIDPNMALQLVYLGMQQQRFYSGHDQVIAPPAAVEAESHTT